MGKRRKRWAKMVEEAGIEIRIYERANSSRLWYSFVKEDGSKVRKSLKTTDRKLAEKRAKAIARKVAEMRLLGTTPETLTLSQLQTVYERECGHLLSKVRRREVKKAFRLWGRHVGADFPVADLGPHQVQTYTAARKSGDLATRRGRNGGKGVRAGTIAKELGVLHAAFNWAETYKRNGAPILSRNPIRGTALPSEPNPARPVATPERFNGLVEQANEVDDTGAFHAMLYLAWYTGRRLGSIVALRASDVLLTPDQIAGAIAEAGMEEYLAEAWPAAIRWAAEADKEGVEWIVPIPEILVEVLGHYIRDRGLVGNALLFPARRDATKPLPKETAYYWLRQAEKLAELPHQRRGGWHAFRRAWATKRKHMPLQDVMAAGGWKDPAALQRAYQHADAETVRKVMELE